MTLLLGIICAHAAAVEPERRLRAYHNPQRESVLRVRTARIAFADYELLQRDFPRLREKSRAEIDRWLLDRAGYMSRRQVLNPQASELNTPIDADPNDIASAYRPESYGRGLVFEAPGPDGAPEGLLDGKGFGALAPRNGINGSGLLPLAEALREIVWEGVARRIFEAEAPSFSTVRCYAAIDWGFDLRASDGSLAPAGAVLRQAHSRETWNFNSNLPRDRALEAELALRRYGVTTAGLSESLRRQAQVPFDLINVQGRALPGGGALVVDFGTFVRVPPGHRFERPIAVRETRFFSAGVLTNTQGGNREVGVLSAVLAKDDPRFVAHVERGADVPAEHFASTDPGRLIPETDAVSRAAAEWARAWREEAGRNARSARAKLEKAIGLLRAKLRIPSRCELIATGR